MGRLAAVNFFIQPNLNIYQPVLMAGFLMWLLGDRVLYRRNGEVTPLHLVLLAVGAAAATAIGEATIYYFTSGLDARRILLAPFHLQLEVATASWVPAASP